MNEAETSCDEERYQREAEEIGRRLVEMQAEEDARLELDVERVERALEWERCRARVTELKAELAHTLGWRKRRFEGENETQLEFGEECLHADAAALLVALDELERLEERA